MKKSNLYLLVLILLPVITSCGDKFDQGSGSTPSLNGKYLNVSESTFSSPEPDAFSRNFNVESSQTSWRFTNMADWFSLSPTSGSQSSPIVLNVSQNTDATAARTGIFYLKSTDTDWDFQRTLSVTQAKAILFLHADKTDLSFGGGDGTQTINIQSNSEWVAQCPNNWISLSADVKGGTLRVSVSPNPMKDYRTATINILYGDSRPVSINITQSPAEVNTSDYNLFFENTAGEYSLTIESQAEWTSSTSAAWITVNPNSGPVGKSTVSIEVSPNTSINERTGFVAIMTDGNEKSQITITQKGIYIESEDIKFKASGGSQILSIKSNTEWTITDYPSWISFSKTKGQGNDNLTVTAEANPSTSSRNGTIIISQSELSFNCNVTVTQSGITISPETSLLEFSDKAGQLQFELEADGSWSSTISADWFTATPVAGTGTTEITVAVQENNTYEERIGTINYIFGEQKAQVNVHQLAKYMNIDGDQFVFDADGGNHTVELATNDKWEVSIEGNAQWLSISPTSGSDDAVINISAQPNNTLNERNAIVIISNNNSQDIRIMVSQNARYLNVSTQNIMLFAEGGSSDPVTVESNGDYTISSDSSWFTINEGAGNTFTVYATKNNTTELRKGTISIKLNNLSEGSLTKEISVIQAGEGGSFILNGYPQDQNWNSNASSNSIKISVNGYSSEQNWNSTGVSNSNKISINGYSSEQNWN